MPSYTKSQLLAMNSSPTMGCNWILNIENIPDNGTAVLYPTGHAGLGCGRLHVALPENIVLTPDIVKYFNIWV